MCQCRQTLMYTYVFAYYLKKNNQSVIFEVSEALILINRYPQSSMKNRIIKEIWSPLRKSSRSTLKEILHRRIWLISSRKSRINIVIARVAVKSLPSTSTRDTNETGGSTARTRTLVLRRDILTWPNIENNLRCGCGQFFPVLMID